MKYHILNGDALLKQLPQTFIRGRYIVMRECLVDGNVQADTLEDFWKIRAQFIEQAYGGSQDEYFSNCVSEILKIQDIPENSSVYLWFERDLFCQVNLWFILFLIKNILSEKNLYPFLVLPHHHEWTGFGNMTSADLEVAYDQKIKLTDKETAVFANLWRAYQQHDTEQLVQLPLLLKKSFPYLPEVVQAHLDRYPENSLLSRPYQMITDIIHDMQTTEFNAIFEEYCRRDGIYGFGDLQVKRIYDQVLKKTSL